MESLSFALPLAAALAVIAASLTGAAFASRRIGVWTERNLKYLVASSIGVFAVVAWHLLHESVEHEGFVPTAIAAVLGALAIGLVARILPDAHHHHSVDPGHGHSTLDARRLLVGDALHNFGDGLLLVPAFALGLEAGLAATAAILFHEIVQEISEFFVLKEAGYSTRRALALNALSSSSILLGLAASYALSSVEEIEGLIASFAAAGFIYVVLRDLLPHTVRAARKDRNVVPYALVFVIGLVAMTVVSSLVHHG